MLLNEAGYKAIDKFENTKGTTQGTSMGKGDGYSRIQEKEIKSLIENSIGLETWNKIPGDIQTQFYSFAFNSKKDNRQLQGLAQSLSPDIIKTDDDRRNLSKEEAIKIIQNKYNPKAPEATTAGAFVTPQLIDKVIQTESANNPKATSPKGAKGLMQLMDATGQEYAKKLGLQYDPFNPEQNKLIGTKVLENLYKKYNNMTHTLMAYNWGQGNVDKWLKGELKNIPTETKNYIFKILEEKI